MTPFIDSYEGAVDRFHRGRQAWPGHLRVDRTALISNVAYEGPLSRPFGRNRAALISNVAYEGPLSRPFGRDREGLISNVAYEGPLSGPFLCNREALISNVAYEGGDFFPNSTLPATPVTLACRKPK